MNTSLSVPADVAAGEETLWMNPAKTPLSHCADRLPFTKRDIEDAARRLERFAPLIAQIFPETAAAGGVIESPLSEIDAMKTRLCREQQIAIRGRLLLKRDDSLPISGSVKARGGIYEVLKHTETLALANGLLRDTADDYRKLAAPAAKRFFAGQKIQVGSTGNLGMSIGIMSAALGYEAIVHMSADAKAWKKALLREKGAIVREYAGDYKQAVDNGRSQSAADANSYFVDDEHSGDLFCGYATAGERLKRQLDAAHIPVDAAHPLFVYLPCGVGGAPGGVTFGLKHLFGEYAHCFLIEPTQAPCMLLGLATGLYENVSVQDIGLTGQTQADGLAVGRASAPASRVSHALVSGVATVRDERLPAYLRALWQSEHIFIEPSACAAFQGVVGLHATDEGAAYLRAAYGDRPEQATHILWATGGGMAPDSVRRALLGE